MTGTAINPVIRCCLILPGTPIRSCADLDCFGRIGGEEFMFILPDTTLGDGLLFLDRVLARIRSARPLTNCPEFSYTCSAGITALRPGDTPHEVFARADRGLYQAKLEGRNRVSVI